MQWRRALNTAASARGRIGAAPAQNDYGYQSCVGRARKTALVAGGLSTAERSPVTQRPYQRLGLTNPVVFADRACNAECRDGHRCTMSCMVAEPGCSPRHLI